MSDHHKRVPRIQEQRRRQTPRRKRGNRLWYHRQKQFSSHPQHCQTVSEGVLRLLYRSSSDVQTLATPTTTSEDAPRSQLTDSQDTRRTRERLRFKQAPEELTFEVLSQESIIIRRMPAHASLTKKYILQI